MNFPLPNIRLRRLRQHPMIRNLIRETELNLNDLVHPLFIKGISGKKNSIPSMPGHYQIPLDQLDHEIEELANLGISSVILFGIPPHKDKLGSDSFQENGIIQQAIRKIKQIAPDLLIIADTCFCEYTDHGHCGVMNERSAKHGPDNDETLNLLIKQSVSQAQAGADIIAPSGMIDGMVQAIRYGLDQEGFKHIPILSYSVKYHSHLYGPFRFAAEGAPQSGDRSSHQMDPANTNEAIRECELDIQEGADMIMVKPAHTYLDIIYRIKSTYSFIPLGAYHTSGEFCMIKAAAKEGWINEEKTVFEILNAIKRAGADFIITYYAKEFARWIKSS